MVEPPSGGPAESPSQETCFTGHKHNQLFGNELIRYPELSA
jgi:hypothetical protein